MDALDSLRIFLEVARRQSFAATALHFGVSPAKVTKHVAALEHSLQATLLNRTTKKMSLTPAGAAVVESGQRAIASYEEMRERVASLSNELQGEVRVGVAAAFAARRMPVVMKAFARRYPGLRLSLTLLTFRKEETFVAEGMDVGIIAGASLKDARHKAIKLADVPQVLVASPEYLQGIEAPRTPADLINANCLVNVNKTATGYWHFEGPDGPVGQRVTGTVRSNFGEVLCQSALGGLGISMHPLYMVAEEIASGQLCTVLPDYRPEPLQLFAIFSASEALPVSVRAFLDFLRNWAPEHPQWPGINA